MVLQCILLGDLHNLGKDNQSHSERNKITSDDQCPLILVQVILQSCSTQQKHIQNVALNLPLQSMHYMQGAKRNENKHVKGFGFHWLQFKLV